MSFSQEVKDFISGYQTVTESAQKSRALDQQAKEAESTRKLNERRVAVEEGKLKVDQQRASAYADATRKAVSSGTSGTSSAIAVPDYLEEDGTSMATGGVVRALHAVGGTAVPAAPATSAIPTEEEQTAEDNWKAAQARRKGERSYIDDKGQRQSLYAMNGKARNTYGDEVKPMSDMEANQSVGPGANQIFGSATKAISQAFKSFSKDTRSKGAIGATESDIDYSTGKGAATPEEIKAIDAKIDPEGKMNASDRAAARYAFVYDHFNQAGEPEKAESLAKRIVLFDKMNSEARGKIAANLINTGNPAEGARILADAYNENIHDGQRIEVTPVQGGNVRFEITKDGKTIQRGNVTPEQLAAMAAGTATGAEFTRRTAAIAASAGGGDTGGGEPAPAPAPAPSEAPATPEAAIPAEAPATPEAAIPTEEPAASGENPPPLEYAKELERYQRAAARLIYWQSQEGPEAEQGKFRSRTDMKMMRDRAIAAYQAGMSKNSNPASAINSVDNQLNGLRDLENEDLKAMVDQLEANPPTTGAATSEAVPTEGKEVFTPANQAELDPAQAGYGFWNVAGTSVFGPPADQLKLSLTSDQIAKSRAAIKAGMPVADIVKMLLKAGVNPTGL
jgi:hypothetical protein